MELTALLPSSAYTLAYTIPLLLSSLCTTFAGAFLTLDRTRSFPPKYDSILIPPSKFHWLLEGGIGGLAAGYVFGGALTASSISMVLLMLQVKSTCPPFSL
jgi:hypothetical protein